HLTTTADWLGLGPWRVAVPLWLFWGLGVAVVAMTVRNGILRDGLGVALCLAASALMIPVLFTTASALETQAFVLVYFLGFAFLAEAAVARIRRREPLA